MFEKYKDVVTVYELCKMLGIGRNMAYRLLCEKKICSVRIGRVHRIPKSSVIRYIEKSGSA